jgi:hypothetical protein
MSGTQVDPDTSGITLPDLAAIGFRPTHYAGSPEIRSLYADECQRCGMCCIYFSEHPFCVPIAGEPYRQPPKKFVQIGPTRRVIGTNRFLRIAPDKAWDGHNRCAALVGTQGVNVSCSIYDRRPFACSDYEPGSPDCFKVRKWASLEPLEDGYGRS